MDKKEWQCRNRNSISKKIKSLLDNRDGTIFDEIMASGQEMLIEKRENLLKLYFVDSVTDEFSGAMSEIDLKHPLRLTAPYQKGMMLSLLWGEPKRIYVLGFGGGRVGSILHHYFPNAVVESTEIDPDVLNISKRFFGVELDENLRVALQDGRDYLKESKKKYDIIIIDGYSGTNQIPYHLRTKQFYNLCKKKLSKGGVVVVNLVDNNPQYMEGVNTMMASFDNVYLMRYSDADLYFGSEKKLKGGLIKQMEEIQEDGGFDFSILPMVKCLKPISKQKKYLKKFRQSDDVFEDL